MNLWQGLSESSKMSSGCYLANNILFLCLFSYPCKDLFLIIELDKKESGFSPLQPILLASVVQGQNTDDNGDHHCHRLQRPQETLWKQLLEFLLLGRLVGFTAFQKEAPNFWPPLSLSPDISVLTRIPSMWLEWNVQLTRLVAPPFFCTHHMYHYYSIVLGVDTYGRRKQLHIKHLSDLPWAHRLSHLEGVLPFQ